MKSVRAVASALIQSVAARRKLGEMGAAFRALSLITVAMLGATPVHAAVEPAGGADSADAIVESSGPESAGGAGGDTGSETRVGAPLALNDRAALPSAPPVPPPPSRVTVLPVPKAVMGPTTDPAAAVGPDLPVPRHGRLAGIDWPKAPQVVPPALEDAVNIVTRTYPTSLGARAALRAAAIDLRAARLERLPTLSGNIAWRATIVHDRAYRVNDTSPDPQLQIDLPIWSGGRIEADIARGHANRDSSSASYLDTVNSLALTTAQTYFDIVRLTQREQLLTGSLEEHRRLVGTIDRRVQQEVSPLADLELAKSRTAQVEQDLNTARAQRLTSLRIMAQLVADPTYDVGPIPWFNPDIAIPDSDALEQQAAVYSPMLRRLQAETDVAHAEVSSHRASILPQVDAEYTYDDYYGHRIGGVLRVSNDATQPAQLSAAHIRVDAAEQNRRSSEAELRREVAADLIEFNAAKSRAVIAKAASVSAGKVSESYMRQFIAGRRSWLDVMNELREAVDAQISQSEAEVSVMYTASRLMIESGRWRPKFDAPAAP